MLGAWRIRYRPGPRRRWSGGVFLAPGCVAAGQYGAGAGGPLPVRALDQVQREADGRLRSSSGYFLGAGTKPLSRGFGPATRPGTAQWTVDPAVPDPAGVAAD